MSLNDFVIMQKLGSGSFATVYKARRLIDQQIYALKKIDLKALGTKEKNNALNEIRLLACLSSPYIIGYCQSFFDEKLDLLTIAMEYADEGDLLKKIQKQKKQRSLMPQVQVWKILIHLLYGLNELHSKNILHRDLKAENIFIGKGIYKIGDMNVSKIIKNGLACTQTGTPYYASPEVWNDQPYDQKSDIWSLGCILYEVATLRPPFEATSMEKLFQMVTRANTPKIPNNYSRQLQVIIDSCLQKNPLNRPSTKELLSNNTLKIYENLLIEFKPQVEDIKEPLLKTIYMPNSKRELKNHLPQSNYKNSQGKNLLNQEDLSKPTKKQEEISSTKNNQAIISNTSKNSQTKQALMNIDNFIRQNSESKKQESSKHRNRIQSCQIFKDLSCKKINSKQNLMARADFIIESQRKPNIEKKNIHEVNSGIFLNNFDKKTTSSKEIRINNTEETNKSLKREICIEDQEIIVPKKLIFDEPISSVTEKDVNNQDQHVKSNDDKCNISNQPYLIDTLKNVSIISEKNHSHYKFDAASSDADIKNIEIRVKPIDQESALSKLQEPISPNILLNHESLQPKPANILIDVKENQLVLKPLKEISPQYKMNFILGFQKFKNILQNIIFKNKLFALSSLRNELIRLKMIQKQEQLHLKLYHQSHKEIKETINVSSKPTQQNNHLEKTFQKRSRSKSIRKTQKCKPVSSSASQNNNLILVEKINNKFNIEPSQKGNSKQKSAKKENKCKKIFDKENKPTDECFQNNYHQKLKQIALVPKNIVSSSGSKVSSKQKKKLQQKQNHPKTSQKDKHSALKVIELNNIKPNQSEKKIHPQGICSFEQKKKKIFQSSNPVHDVSDKLDRINLEKKIKRYINF